jgi:1-acyl-sn-glycerol-3-phosphate acyltransferase
MGWAPFDDHIIVTLQQHQKLVCVFSHSSYFDFCIMVLYKLAYPQYLYHMRTLINAYYFTIMGPFLRYVGGIPSYIDRQGGSVQRICHILQEQDCFLFLISPKGSILRKEWKSGYYYISQQLDVPLLAIGLDYEEKRVKMGQLLTTEINETNIKNKLYDDLSHIVPLYPEQENMPIKINHPHHISVISPLRLLSMIGFLSFMYYQL